MKIVGDGADGQGAAEILVAALVLGGAKFGFPQGALQLREKMRKRLGVIPDVRA